jgi:hypothetical protein
MEQLVALIEDLEASDLAPRQYLEYDDHPTVQPIAIMLQAIFITNGGNINLDARDDLRKYYGYELHPVEHDAWGWLLGGLHTKKGIITFG